MTVRGSLWSEYQRLTKTVDASAASAVRCGSSNQHLLLKGQFGEPVLLLSAMPRTTPRADIQLKHVQVTFDKQFEVASSESGITTVGTFCKFTCDADSPHLHRYFVELMAATAGANDGVLTQEEADAVVGALLELFRKLALPPQRSVAGLWGELLLMHLASEPKVFVEAWHTASTDCFDFAFHDTKIEVKSTERQTREHDFSLRQVRSSESGNYVASVILSRSAAGLSSLDLTRLIAERVDTKQRAKLWSLVLETLGDDAEAAEDQRYDLKAATESVVFIPAGLVPAPTVDTAAAPYVSDVRFRANVGPLCVDCADNRSEILGRVC